MRILRSKISQIIAGFILLTLITLGGAAKYAESPHFCKSCHIMEPYYEAWKTSKHNFVPCVECHYPPGTVRTILWKKFQALSQVAKYVTRTYSSKPFAEIEDTSCLRSGCHSTRLLEGKMVTAKGIKFDHAPHLMTERRGRHLRCVSCHSQIVVGNHVEVTYNTCYLCHFRGHGEGRTLEPVGGCLGCHELPSKSFAIGNMTFNHRDFVTKQGVSCMSCHFDAVKGSGDVLQERCYTCHNQPEKIARIDDIPFIHENHVTKHNVACFHCHQEMRHGFTAEGGTATVESRRAGPWYQPVVHEKIGRAGLTFECGACHENKHSGQLQMYSGKTSALGLPDIPSPMYMANVDCVGCHYAEEKGATIGIVQEKTFAASPQACVKCHGPEYTGMWDTSKVELSTTLAAIEKKLETARDELKKAKPDSESTATAKEALDQARTWVVFVRNARGLHNIYLASVVLRRADAAISDAGDKLGATLPDLAAMPLLSGTFCATTCHIKVNVHVPAETVQVWGKTMPHKKHTETMKCVDCHELGAHKDARLKEGVRDMCEGCHTL